MRDYSSGKLEQSATEVPAKPMPHRTTDLNWVTEDKFSCRKINLIKVARANGFGNLKETVNAFGLGPDEHHYYHHN